MNKLTETDTTAQFKSPCRGDSGGLTAQFKSPCRGDSGGLTAQSKSPCRGDSEGLTAQLKSPCRGDSEGLTAQLKSPYRGDSGGLGLHFKSADPFTYGLLKEFVKNNRQFPTEAERHLWQSIGGDRLGVRFRRQHIIGEFIVDFVCIPAGLIIEVDGGYHSLLPQQIADSERTRILEEKGYRVIRFSNEEVLYHLDRVLEEIKALLNKAPLNPPCRGTSSYAANHI